MNSFFGESGSHASSFANRHGCLWPTSGQPSAGPLPPASHCFNGQCGTACSGFTPSGPSLGQPPPGFDWWPAPDFYPSQHPHTHGSGMTPNSHFPSSSSCGPIPLPPRRSSRYRTDSSAYRPQDWAFYDGRHDAPSPAYSEQQQPTHQARFEQPPFTPPFSFRRRNNQSTPAPTTSREGRGGSESHDRSAPSQWASKQATIAEKDSKGVVSVDLPDTIGVLAELAVTEVFKSCRSGDLPAPSFFGRHSSLEVDLNGDGYSVGTLSAKHMNASARPRFTDFNYELVRTVDGRSALKFDLKTYGEGSENRKPRCLVSKSGEIEIDPKTANNMVDEIWLASGVYSNAKKDGTGLASSN